MESKLRLIVSKCTFRLLASSLKDDYSCRYFFILFIPKIYYFEYFEMKDNMLKQNFIKMIASYRKQDMFSQKENENPFCNDMKIDLEN